MKKLAIITGFLGSGKTTILNRLLRQPDMESTAVLVNELGEVGVDNLIVDRLDDEIVLLESGCVCCSVRDDLTTALLNLYSCAERGDIPAYSQAVLETTGIADPGEILQLLMTDADVTARYRIASVNTVVDACFAAENLDEIPEAVRQVMLADRLLISKSDLVDDLAISSLRSRLAALNPGAPFVLSDELQPSQLIAPPADRLLPPAAQNSGHGHRYATFQVGWPGSVEWSAIATWIEGLLSARGDDIWRIKGLLNVRGEPRPIVFQSVQHAVYAPARLAEWPRGGPRSELTFITRHFSRPAALASLRPFVDLMADA